MMNKPLHTSILEKREFIWDNSRGAWGSPGAGRPGSGRAGTAGLLTSGCNGKAEAETREEEGLGCKAPRDPLPPAGPHHPNAPQPPKTEAFWEPRVQTHKSVRNISYPKPQQEPLGSRGRGGAGGGRKRKQACRRVPSRGGGGGMEGTKKSSLRGTAAGGNLAAVAGF